MIHYNWNDNTTLVDLSENQPDKIELKIYDKTTDKVTDVFLTEQKLKELYKFLGTYLETHNVKRR